MQFYSTYDKAIEVAALEINNYLESHIQQTAQARHFTEKEQDIRNKNLEQVTYTSDSRGAF
jgi:hypothetical protein